jgi:catechol 2,3-dioxygenase-like lactoylglutathione lyase family enzyme
MSQARRAKARGAAWTDRQRFMNAASSRRDPIFPHKGVRDGLPPSAAGVDSVKLRRGAIRSPGKPRREYRMFSHVMIGTNDLEKAKSFYDALLGTLGIAPGRVDRHRIFYRSKTGTFSVSLPIDGKPACHANGGTIGFAADSPEAADAFHAAGIAHGGKTCEEPPGIREGSGMKLYIAYLRDPDGNKLCALHRIP